MSAYKNKRKNDFMLNTQKKYIVWLDKIIP